MILLYHPRALSITFETIRGVALISIDEYGNGLFRLMAISQIGSGRPRAKDGYTPMVNVDKYGFGLFPRWREHLGAHTERSRRPIAPGWQGNERHINSLESDLQRIPIA